MERELALGWGLANDIIGIDHMGLRYTPMPMETSLVSGKCAKKDFHISSTKFHVIFILLAFVKSEFNLYNSTGNSRHPDIASCF